MARMRKGIPGDISGKVGILQVPEWGLPICPNYPMCSSFFFYSKALLNLNSPQRVIKVVFRNKNHQPKKKILRFALFCRRWKRPPSLKLWRLQQPRQESLPAEAIGEGREANNVASFGIDLIISFQQDAICPIASFLLYSKYS